VRGDVPNIRGCSGGNGRDNLKRCNSYIELGVDECSFRGVSRDDNLAAFEEERISVISLIEEERRARNDGDGGDDDVSSCLHFSEQYSNELFGTLICF
jgi:hypothetical protein